MLKTYNLTEDNNPIKVCDANVAYQTTLFELD